MSPDSQLPFALDQHSQVNEYSFSKGGMAVLPTCQNSSSSFVKEDGLFHSLELGSRKCIRVRRQLAPTATASLLREAQVAGLFPVPPARLSLCWQSCRLAQKRRRAFLRFLRLRARLGPAPASRCCVSFTCELRAPASPGFAPQKRLARPSPTPPLLPELPTAAHIPRPRRTSSLARQ